VPAEKLRTQVSFYDAAYIHLAVTLLAWVTFFAFLSLPPAPNCSRTFPISSKSFLSHPIRSRSSSHAEVLQPCPPELHLVSPLPPPLQQGIFGSLSERERDDLSSEFSIFYRPQAPNDLPTFCPLHWPENISCWRGCWNPITKPHPTPPLPILVKKMMSSAVPQAVYRPQVSRSFRSPVRGLHVFS